MRHLFATTLCVSLAAIVLSPVITNAHAQALGVVKVERVDYNEVETNPDTNAQFGYSVARIGDLMLVGARQHNDLDGAVYVFRVESDASLTYLSEIVNENPNPYFFGELITGDQGWAAIRNASFRVQLFEQTGNDFVFRQELDPLTVGDIEMVRFDAMDMSGNTLMIGDQDANVGTTTRGVVAVYERSGGTWALHSMIPNPLPTGTEVHAFGAALAISGDLAVITDPYVESIDGSDWIGAVYVYERDAGNTWQLIKTLEPKVEDYEPNGTRFGWSVAVDQDTIAVGCSMNCNNDVGNRDSVYIFERNQGGVDNWGLAQEITGVPGEYFPLHEQPQALYLRGDVLAFGTDNIGQMHVFTRVAAGMPFAQWAFIDESADGDLAYFGYSIDGSGTSIVMGSPGSGNNLGAAYAYRIVQTCHGPDTIYCDDFEGFLQQP